MNGVTGCHCVTVPQYSDPGCAGRHSGEAEGNVDQQPWHTVECRRNHVLMYCIIFLEARMRPWAVARIVFQHQKENDSRTAI